MGLSRKTWRRVALIFQATGFGAFACLFVLWLVLIVYYTGHRPHAPRPELCLIVPLPWTHPTSYGSAADAARLFWVFWCLPPAFAIAAIGYAIRIYILDEAALGTRH